MGYVYILHFNTKYRHAAHYVGFANSDVDKRIERHRNGGSGAKLMDAISENGIGFQVARIWENADRWFERRIKRRKNTKNLCPVCNPQAMNNAKEANPLDKSVVRARFNKDSYNHRRGNGATPEVVDVGHVQQSIAGGGCVTMGEHDVERNDSERRKAGANSEAVVEEQRH